MERRPRDGSSFPKTVVPYDVFSGRDEQRLDLSDRAGGSLSAQPDHWLISDGRRGDFECTFGDAKPTGRLESLPEHTFHSLIELETSRDIKRESAPAGWPGRKQYIG